MKLVILIFLIISLSFITSSISASNLLQNYDFESDTINPWTTSGGSAAATVSAEIKHSGNYSLKVQHSKISTYGFQQTILDIESGKYYQAIGYGSSNNNNTASYFIRLGWYNDQGDQFSTSDTDEITLTNGDWTKIQKTIQAPDNSKTVKMRLVLKSDTSGINASAFFDDLSFEQVADPTPTFTPTPNTPTPTSSPTEKSIPTPTPTKKPATTATTAPTKLPSNKPTSTTITNKEDGTEVNLPQSILGVTVTPSTSSSSASIKTGPDVFSFRNIIFIAGGIILILSGGLVFTFVVKDRFKKI